MIARARAAAFSILLKVATTDAHSDELLRSREVDALSAQDRALTTALALGTLRWQLNLDARIRAELARPEGKLAPAVETALRLGAFQLGYMDRIPAHAAIGESVELTKQAGEKFAAGMVNAVLRKLARPASGLNAGGSASESAHPEWLFDRWVSFYGRETAAAICAFDQTPAGICLRLAHPDAERSLADEGVELAPREFLHAARRLVQGDVVRSETFRRGWVRILDEGSQLVAELAGRGAKILDTCAAPGGKTAILSERNPEATITAMDASARRLDAMRRNYSDRRIEFSVQDATAMRLKPEFDLILCDVPCTGTGTIARNPEIRFRVNEEGIARQHARQTAILGRALEGLAPGGRLLYSTCSLEPEENEAVIEECREQAAGVEVISLKDEVLRLQREGSMTESGALKLIQTGLQGTYLRTLPGVHGCDGFFAALFVRR